MYTICSKATTKITPQRVISNETTKVIKWNHKKASINLKYSRKRGKGQ